jgi:hypothetical protein
MATENVFVLINSNFFMCLSYITTFSSYKKMKKIALIHVLF